MKICKKCGIEKELVEFYKHKTGKFGVKASCKCCVAENNAKPENKARQVEYRAEYYAKPENVAKKAEYMAEYNVEYNAKPEVKAKKAEYAAKPENKAKQAEYMVEYAAKPENKAKKAEYKAEHEKERRATDPLFKLRCNIRNLIGNSIRNAGFKKSSKTAQILGCTFEEFYTHIESQFIEGMGWDNRELWHLDHIYPVSLAESEEHLLQLNHYTNFQPLWAEDNIRKGNKINQ